MQFFPAALQNLADQFAKLPGIGGKTAQRLAFHVLSLPMEDAEEFSNAILEAKKQVHTCPVCQNLTDREVCPICDDDTRDKGVICVVAEPKDVIAMERSREFRGVYHVLHGVISPLNHVSQDDIRIILIRHITPAFLDNKLQRFRRRFTGQKLLDDCNREQGDFQRTYTCDCVSIFCIPQF